MKTLFKQHVIVFLIFLFTVASRGVVVPRCRFSPTFSDADVVRDPSCYVSDLLYWEGKFHQNNVGINTANGMTYDGTLINETTGIATVKHPFSAASKESLQIMLYTHAISKSPLAARFLSPEHPADAPEIVYNIMKLKLKTYLRFNESFPGFGGFIPWFLSNETDLRPTSDWVNRVPGLDNGELLWAVYSFIEAAGCSEQPRYRHLAKEWQKWLDYAKIYAAKIFYSGFNNGTVCAVVTIANQSLLPMDRKQNYSCEGTSVLNDPYEGELFTWWLYFFGKLSKRNRDLLWIAKRKQLVKTEYKFGNLGPITVQKGFWFSAHEQWKFLEMPYLDIPLLSRLYRNAERVRTCNSHYKHIPGMYASVNNSTNTSTGEIIGYISNAGIPSISFITMQELDVVTPYSVFPVLLIDQKVGLLWWKRMVDVIRMENPYGSSESLRIDGTATSSFVSWDSKITTVNALLGGVYSFVRTKMQKDSIYDEFIRVTKREYERVFHDKLQGEEVDFCLPNAKVPMKNILKQYTQCQ